MSTVNCTGQGPAGEEMSINQTAGDYSKKLWDAHEEQILGCTKETTKKKYGSSIEKIERIKSLVRILKTIISIIVFIGILASSVVSKISLMFMVSHIAEDRKVPYCNIHLPHDVLEVTIPSVQRIGWIWALIISFAIPELGSLFRAWRFCFFKSVPRPNCREFSLVVCAESLHVVGMALLIFKILPNLNVIQGVMLTNCLCFLPGLLNIFTDIEKDRAERTKIILVLNIFALCGQITGLIVWPLMYDTIEMWHIPAAIILISCHWWENFVSEKSRFTTIVKLNEIKKLIDRTRYRTYLYVSAWKILVFIICAIFLSDINTIDFFTDFLPGWGNHTIITDGMLHQPVFAAPSAIHWTFLIQIIASYLCYLLSKFACKIKIQAISFSLAINLTVPVSVCILLFVCVVRENNVCAFHDVLPDFLFFVPPPVSNLSDNIIKEFTWVSILWLMSQIWISRHIWNPSSVKNASTDTLFVTPIYNGLIIDQSLVLNRRRHSLSVSVENNAKQTTFDSGIRPEDKIPQVYVCATMWREEKEEMLTFLNSILRLDEDQCARRLARKYFHAEVNDCAYYDMETHIFFDNAFEKDQNINEYVKMLITCIPDASQEVYKTGIIIPPPLKYDTPYGGRLEYTLPGGTKMIVHLKHADKVRKKKRWSQVMYMYYLMSYKIMQQPDMNEARKAVRAKNTYILAIDGDIDFQPDAVHLLINRMKVDEKLGAACGRVHPVGSGPLVWYQKFEYAMGHWFQKATEHVIGCVLCAPGCFSMFRGSALLTSVMRKFTKTSEEAIHYIQYDQGEDRWLCTLIIKQNFRVEYSAAADAYTHSPVGFNELYIQRRRWIPSTIVNLCDILNESAEIVKKNDNISILYMAYQLLLLVGTIIGPGTIFLVMIGSFVAVFSIDIWPAFVCNMIPIILFMIICYKSTNNELKLETAWYLTIVYSLVMTAVLTGMIINSIKDGLLSPSSVLFAVVAGQVIIAGLLHPQELGCLICGIIYYLTVPSMFMLLVIYSIFNMNNVNWGTRQGADANQKVEKVENKYDLLGMLPCVSGTKPKSTGDDEKLQKIIDELHEIKYHLKSGTYNALASPSNEMECSVVNVQSPEATKIVDWQNDPDVMHGASSHLDSIETEFWNGLIDKYLQPIDEHNMKDREVKEKQLGELRDKYVFAFIMLNTLFVLIVFSLQLNKDVLHLKWPFGAENQIFFGNSSEVIIKRDYMQIDPIIIVFVIFLGLVKVIEFFAMLMHRFGTLSQILAETDLDWSCQMKMGRKKLVAENKMNDIGCSVNGPNAVKFAKKLQKPTQFDDDDVCDVEHVGQAQDQSNLEVNFRRNNGLSANEAVKINEDLNDPTLIRVTRIGTEDVRNGFGNHNLGFVPDTSKTNNASTVECNDVFYQNEISENFQKPNGQTVVINQDSNIIIT